MAMDDLLKALLQGGAAQPQDEAEGAGDLGDLLQGLLGGAAGAPVGGQGPESGFAIGDLLGGILGGATGGTAQPAAGSAGGLGDILGGILGGGSGAAQGASSGGGLASMLGPVVQSLAQKLGLPPSIAQAVVGFAMAKLLPALLGGMTAKSQPAAVAPEAAPAQKGGFDLDDLLDRVGSGNPQRLSTSYIQSTGWSTELAEQTGLDEETAAASLQQTFLALSGQMSPAKPAAAPKKQARKTASTTSKTQAKPKAKKPPARKHHAEEA